MCIYIDDDGWTLDSGERRARKAHTCHECNREIEPGETYQYWTVIEEYGDKPTTLKMCAHCWATIELGAALTGCPKNWWWGEVNSYEDDEGAFLGDIVHNHYDLSFADQMRMIRRAIQARRKWRRPNGELYPLPTVTVAS